MAVKAEDAQTSHGLLQARGIQGTFHPLTGVGHRIDTAVLTKLQKVLETEI